MDTIFDKDEKFSLESSISNALLNHLYEGIYFVDKNRILQFWNTGAKTITGYTADEIVGKSCFDNILCHKSEAGHNLCTDKCPLVKCMEEDIYIDARVYLKHKEGHRVPVWVHVNPIKNKDGDIIGAVEVFIDDTAYENLKNVNKELEKLNEQKNQFLGMAAHDLRNPLTVVTGFSSFLLLDKSDKLDTKHFSMIKKIKNAANTMLFLINDLLDISTIESGKITLEKEKIRVEDFLDINNYSMKLIADQKNIDIEVKIQPDLPSISIDVNRMSQVIENLLSNAVKFSYPESKVIISAELIDDKLCISFKDEGQGIAENDLPKLFKPFQKTETRPTNHEPSTGLGLVITKKILKMHNGTIEVKSKLNQGSEFIIKIPINEKD